MPFSFTTGAGTPRLTVRDAVAPVLFQLMEAGPSRNDPPGRGEWSETDAGRLWAGTAAELLDLLERRVSDEVRRRRGWPKTAVGGAS
jgi:hypothetical protein